MAQEILETGKPLSKSILWQIQEDSFRSSGIDAWEQIPAYPTTNPFIADVYARLIVAYLLDSIAHLAPEEPVYILELGAGTGRFGFHCLAEVERRRRYFAALEGVKVVYVLTDIAEKNVRFWEEHDGFRAFREAGQVDFALFHPDRERTVELRAAQTRLAPGMLKNPLIVISNYVFDSMRQDLFRVAGGGLEEVRLSISREVPEVDPAPPSVDQLVVEQTPVTAAVDYYGDARLDSILRHYVESLEEGSILFPVAAFDCIRNLEALAGGAGLVLLSSDKGFSHMGYMSGHWEHTYSLHGGVCLSYMVNYHAIRHYVEEGGGVSFFTADDDLFLQTLMSILPARPAAGGYELCRYGFEEALGRQNQINDLYNIQQYIAAYEPPEDPKARLHRCLSIVRLCRNDPVVYQSCGEEIGKAVDELIARDGHVGELAGTLLEVTDRVRENHYLVNSADRDVLQTVGSIYYSLERYDRCVEAFERAVELFGPDAYSLYFIASCHEVAESYDAALETYERGAALDPSCELTQAGLKRMRLLTKRV
jgi:tetratricopeptide (TPR) repeat protein